MKKLNVLIIGSGAREHAIAFFISKSPILGALYILPGNPGMKDCGEIVAGFNQSDFELLKNFTLEKKIDLIIIGPEQPLVDGLADFLRQNGVKVFGPSQKAAAIEGEKSFAKDLMRKYSIPTADYKIFESKDKKIVIDYLRNIKYPTVIKADGLAAGKGVAICDNFEAAYNCIGDYFEKKIFGKAGEKIVIEEFMRGQEASIFAITDGNNFICLPAAQDHKRVLDNDQGKNTGGMGAYAPTPFIDDKIFEEIKNNIISKTIEALRLERREFIGCLYAGLMLTEQGPKVVEFNCRFGDPETQVVLPLIESDLLELLYTAASGKLNASEIKIKKGCCVGVVGASKGYPDEFKKGYEIQINDKFDSEKGEFLFFAGVAEKNGKLITNGGRVFTAVAFEENNDLAKCKEKAYSLIKKINFDNIYYRTDIAQKAINYY